LLIYFRIWLYPRAGRRPPAGWKRVAKETKTDISISLRRLCPDFLHRPFIDWHDMYLLIPI
jgi:hypothetical protein